MKTVLLDLGGVVFLSTDRMHPYIQWPHISSLNKKYGAALDMGEDVFVNFLSDYNILTGQSLRAEEFLAALFDTLDFNDQLIEKLKSLGTIIIVSDNYRENITYLSKRFRFEEWSKAAFYSYDLKAFKSNVLFFEKLLRELNICPDQLLLIDDDPRNVETAKSLKMEGIIFQNNEQTFSELEKFFHL